MQRQNVAWSTTQKITHLQAAFRLKQLLQHARIINLTPRLQPGWLLQNVTTAPCEIRLLEGEKLLIGRWFLSS